MYQMTHLAPMPGHPRVHRQVSYDIPTFDALHDAKRALSEELGRPLTNSGVLRLLLLSHPIVRAGSEEASDGVD